jgi:short-subunit dehydrogenase
MKIDQQTMAVITGAGSGIGRALARQLAMTCGGLALVDLDAEGLAETVRLVGTSNCHLTTHCLDVANRAAMAELAGEVMETHGRVNLLINNAGVALGGRVSEVSLDDIEWLIGINFWGVVHGVKYFLPFLPPGGPAHIVNISSVFGMIAPPGQAAYAASKFAVRGFTEALAHELSGSGIKVSVVHPGGVRTNIARRARAGAETPLSRAEKERLKFDQVAMTEPESAARTIIRGIERNRRRILIGPDAWLIDRLQRFFPVKHRRLLEIFFS